MVDFGQTAKHRASFTGRLSLVGFDIDSDFLNDLSRIQMPALKSVSIDLSDGLDNWTPESGLDDDKRTHVWYLQEKVEAARLFNDSLPQSCRDRAYKLFFATSWSMLPKLMEHISAMSSTSTLGLMISADTRPSALDEVPDGESRADDGSL